MNKRIVSFLVFFLFLWQPFLFSQNLPALPQDSRIQRGSFANGVNYYVTPTDRTAATASFALVVKHCSDSLTLLDRPVRRLGGDSIREFVKRNHISSDKDAFISLLPTAARISFPEVRIPDKQSLDSMLMIVSDLTDAILSLEDSAAVKRFSGKDCCIIIAGDVNAGKLIEDLASMQLMIPSTKLEINHPQDKGELSDMLPSYRENSSSFSVSYRFSRIPDRLMGTIQYAVIRKMVGQFAAVLKDKLLRLAQQNGHRPAHLAINYISSGDSPYQEELIFKIRKDSTFDAKSELLLCLYEMGNGGITMDETLLSSKAYLRDLGRRSVSGSRSIGEYMSLCISSFLYGTPLSSYEQLLAFSTSRQISDSVSLKLLNRFATAVIGKDSVLTSFAETFAQDSSASSFKTGLYVNLNDSILLPTAVDKKKFYCRILPEPHSKGELWKFSNGVRVIYKRIPTDGRLYWSISLNGGYGLIPSANENNVGQLTELFRTKANLAGIPVDKFHYMAAYQGISLRPELDYSVTSITGESLEDKTDFFMKSLLALVNEGSFDLSSLQDEKLISEADAFVKERFSRMNDGVIVIVGNVAPDDLRKRITPYIKALRTTNSVSIRSQAREEREIKRKKEIVQTDFDQILIKIHSNIPLTAENYYASNIAGLLLCNRVEALLSDSGFELKMHWNFSVRPSDRFSVVMSISKTAPKKGERPLFSEDQSLDITAMHDKLSKLVDGIRDIEPSATEMTAIRKIIVNNHKQLRTSPEYWRLAIVRRYIDAKDFETKAEEKINALSAAKVKEILSALSDGTRIETLYINTEK